MTQRGLIRPPVKDEFTQGTLFTGALAAGYDGCQVTGIVITARCDAAQGKTSIYHYLPVVKLSDFVKTELPSILVHRTSQSDLKDLKKRLAQAGHSEAVLMSVSPVTAIDKLLLPESKKESQQRKLNELRTRLIAAEMASRGDMGSDISWCPSTLRDAVLAECATQNMAGYYFLPRASVDEQESPGYVVLMRQINHISERGAGLILRGLDKNTLLLLREQNEELSSDRIDLAAVMDGRAAIPTGCLRSPDVEHLMQRFSLLYGRIGIEDVASDYVKNLWGVSQNGGA